MNGMVVVVLILLVLFLLILGIGNQSSSSSYWKRIRTLQHLADYINNYDGYPPHVSEIIERNGWTEIIDKYHICTDGKQILTFITENEVGLIEYTNDWNNKDQPEKSEDNRKSTPFTAMETGFELLLPEGVLNYFEVVFAEKTSSTITIYLDELNIIPEEYKEDKLELKGFYPSVGIQDYPLRGKELIVQVRRRRWTNHSTGDIVYRNWDMVAKGTPLTQEFASFLNELHRYSSC